MHIRDSVLALLLALAVLPATGVVVGGKVPLQDTGCWLIDQVTVDDSATLAIYGTAAQMANVRELRISIVNFVPSADLGNVTFRPYIRFLNSSGTAQTAASYGYAAISRCVDGTDLNFQVATSAVSFLTHYSAGVQATQLTDAVTTPAALDFRISNLEYPIASGTFSYTGEAHAAATSVGLIISEQVHQYTTQVVGGAAGLDLQITGAKLFDATATLWGCR